MEWNEAILKGLADLNGRGTEQEILNILVEKNYRNFNNSQTPQRSLNYYLNQKLKLKVRKSGNIWVLKDNNIDSRTAKKILSTDNDANEAKGNSIKGIIELEKKMRGKDPETRKKLVSYIERGVIAEKVKSLTNFKCLICLALKANPLTFRKRNGEYFIEAHHVEFVSTLKRGSLSIENIITVCPNHHRQIHFGFTELLEQTSNSFIYKIDGEIIEIKKIKIKD